MEVLAARQVLVDRGELAGQADRAPHFVGMLEHVDARDDRLAAVGPEQRRQAADGGGLTRAVRPEQAEDRALRDIEIDAVQSPYVAEGLHQAFGVDGAWHVSSPKIGWGSYGKKLVLPVYTARWTSTSQCGPAGNSAMRHTP
jgi:hypothetical protein